MNPELLFCSIVVFSILLGLVITTGLNPKFKCIVILVFIVFIHVFILFLSRLNSVNRIMSILMALDNISASIDKGVVKSIKSNMPLMDDSLKPAFQEFLIQTEDLSKDIEEPLYELGDKLGPLSMPFIKTAVKYERSESPVLLNKFSELIEDNEATRERFIQRTQKYKSHMFYFLIIIGIFIAFCAVMLNILDLSVAIFLHGIGKYLGLSAILLMLTAYIVTQLIYTGGKD